MGSARRYFYEKPHVVVQYDGDGNRVERDCRLILSLVELTHDINTGQPLLIPWGQLHLWRTNLPMDNFGEKDVVALYRDHSTSGQFHSEFKSGLELERLPSQKFATNRLVVAIGQLVFNFFRIIGEKAVKTKAYVSKGPFSGSVSVPFC